MNQVDVDERICIQSVHYMKTTQQAIRKVQGYCMHFRLNVGGISAYWSPSSLLLVPGRPIVSHSKHSVAPEPKRSRYIRELSA